MINIHGLKRFFTIFSCQIQSHSFTKSLNTFFKFFLREHSISILIQFFKDLCKLLKFLFGDLLWDM